MKGQYLYQSNRTETSVKLENTSAPGIFKLNDREALRPTAERIHTKLAQLDPFGTNVVRQLLTNNFF